MLFFFFFHVSVIVSEAVVFVLNTSAAFETAFRARCPGLRLYFYRRHNVTSLSTLFGSVQLSRHGLSVSGDLSPYKNAERVSLERLAVSTHFQRKRSQIYALFKKDRRAIV